MKYYIILLVTTYIFSLDLNAQCNQASGTVIITEPGCNGNDGQIKVIATGGTTPYQYGMGGWTTQSSNIFSGLSAGSYNIRIITADNCVTWIYNIIVSYTPMEFSSSIVNQTCFDYVAGSINIIPTRGVAPYTYSSDGGATYNNVNFFQNLDIGTYSYKVKDANNCIEDAVFTITKSHIAPSVVTTPVKCTGIMGTAAVTFGGPDNYTFSIDNNASVQSGTGFYSYSQLTPGNYQIQCSDINGCNESFDFIVGDENISSTLINIVHETCNEENGSLTMATTNGVGPYQYSIDGGLTFGSSDTFTNLEEDVYTLKVIDSRGCESTNTITLTNTGGVSGTINEDTVICNGSIVELNVIAQGSSLTYTWNNNLSNNSTHNVSPNIDNTYSVSVEDNLNCSITLNTTITVNNYPNLQVSTNQIDICNGDSTTITVSGANDYLWSNGDTTLSTTLKTPYAQDSIIAYGYNGNCLSSISIPVSVHQIDASITDSQHICIGSSTTIYINSATPVAYNWINNTNTTSSLTVAPITETIYDVLLTDSYGCNDTLRTLIKVDEEVNLSVLPTSVVVCSGEPFTLEASGATDYNWTNGESTSSITSNATVNETISISGVNGECSQTTDVQITVLPKPNIEIIANETSINTGDAIQFGIGTSNASSYSWNFGDGSTSNFSLPYHTFIFEGAYNVVLNGNIGSCENSDTLLVYVGTVGINKNTPLQFFIYPNPVKNYLFVSSDNSSKFKIDLKNIEGKSVFKSEKELQETIKVPLLNLKKGIYILNIYSNGQKYSKKIIKQ